MQMTPYVNDSLWKHEWRFEYIFATVPDEKSGVDVKEALKYIEEQMNRNPFNIIPVGTPLVVNGIAAQLIWWPKPMSLYQKEIDREAESIMRHKRTIKKQEEDSDGNCSIQ